MDVRTMGILVGIVNLLLAVMLVVQYRLNRDRGFSGVGWWALGQTAVAVGLVVSVARAATGPVRVAIPLYQSLLVVGTGLILVGLLRFMGRRERAGWLVALTVAFVLWTCFFTFVIDSIEVRSVTFYAVIAGLYVMIVWALARYALASFRGTAQATAVVFALGAAVYLMLALVWVVHPLSDGRAVASSPVVTIAYLASLSATVLWTFGLVAMVNQRLSSEVAVEARNMRSVFATGPDCAIISRRADGVIEDVNEGFTRLSGFTHDEVIGRSTVDIGLWADPRAREGFVTALESGESLSEFPMVLRRRDGSTIDCALAASTIMLDDEPYVITVARDVTAQRRLEAELQHEAATDSLTDLPNRRHFIAVCERELRRSFRSGSPLAIAIIDIDHFKDINDTYGHAAGDLAVVAFVKTVSSSIRDIDTFGRLGGDEFGLLLPDADLDRAVAALERVRAELVGRSHAVGEHRLSLTFSAGVAVVRNEEETVDTVLAHADAALYEAKAQGRNCVVAAAASPSSRP